MEALADISHCPNCLPWHEHQQARDPEEPEFPYETRDLLESCGFQLYNEGQAEVAEWHTRRSQKPVGATP